MAVVQSAVGERLTLAAHTLVGRSTECRLRVDKPRVSTVHALLAWMGEHWVVRDLGSRNGTFVDGTRLTDGGQSPVSLGATLRFASEEWTLVSDAPPMARAVCREEAAEIQEDEDGVLELSSSPLVVILPSPNGWVLDAASAAPRPVRDQDVVTVAGRAWQLELIAPSGPTTSTERAETLLLREATMTFHVSRDLEHVQSELEAPYAKPLKLRSRTFQQVLVALARARLLDHSNGVPPEEAGWVYSDDLQTNLKMDSTRLNLEVHRVRDQLHRRGVVPAHDIVERRRDTQQLRIGVSRLRIHEPTKQRQR